MTVRPLRFNSLARNGPTLTRKQEDGEFEALDVGAGQVVKERKGNSLSLTKYPTAPMIRKPMPTACEILRNSRLSAVGVVSVFLVGCMMRKASGKCMRVRMWV